MIKKRSLEYHLRSSCKRCFPSNFTTDKEGWSIAKKQRTDIDRAGHVCHSKPRSIGHDGLFARVRQNGTKKNARTRRKTTEARLRVCRTAKKNPKKQRGSIAMGTVKIEGLGDEPILWTKMKKVSARRSNGSRANCKRGTRGVGFTRDVMKTPTINPLCHLNRGRCVSRGRGRVVNRYWNGYRFIATLCCRQGCECVGMGD